VVKDGLEIFSISCSAPVLDGLRGACET
jgi:hypothetical protein